MNEIFEVPAGLDPALLYCSTGEDKGDDVNFALGVSSAVSVQQRSQLYQLLVDWLTADRASGLFGCPCRVVLFPRLQAVNVLAIGFLREAGFDKQGKGTGRALLERLRQARVASLTS